MKQELKPCPICGWDVHKSLYGIRCPHCGTAMESEMQSYQDILRQWNNRPDHIVDANKMVQGERLTAEINWEERRFQISKDLLTAGMTRQPLHPHLESNIQSCIQIADELIKQLNNRIMNKIKSKKAKEFIDLELSGKMSFGYKPHAIRAVEVAEQDAEERAVKALEDTFREQPAAKDEFIKRFKERLNGGHSDENL